MDRFAPHDIVERDAVDGATFLNEVAAGYEPVVLRGQAAHWPAVAAGRAGPSAIAAYLTGFTGGAPLEVMIARPEVRGRFFYNDDLTGFNFSRQQVALADLVAELLRLAMTGDPAPHAIYANAAAAPAHSPGWIQANSLDLPIDATARLWIGNANTVATHYDMSPNIACVVAGRRRVTLFPPDQLANLYIGPLDNTLAGPPVSMVDPEAPDLARYPRFEEAWSKAQSTVLSPGDAIYIPALWWHHVRALESFNMLVNYWWAERAAEAPFVALIHAIQAVRDLPGAERRAWGSWFDHFVFDDAAPHAGDHLPQRARTVLDTPSIERTERIRRFLVGSLQRAG